MTISVIIPVLNEVHALPKILDYVIKISNPTYVAEIIIVDGGSTDGTLAILHHYPQVLLVHSKRGRAIQMNKGAQMSTSTILYFLHCDTFPPQNYEIEIIKKVTAGNASGCFRMKFDNNHIVLKVSQWFTRFNHSSCRGGDQSLFVARTLFEQLGGYDENLIIYEDNEFIARLYKNSKFTVIQKSVTTSARKYLQNGVWALQYHFMMIHLNYWRGHNQTQLSAYYKKHIK